MKIKDLIELLTKFNPEAQLVIYRDVDSYGYGDVDKIKAGLFTKTDYGNDFYADTALVINPQEVKAVCLYPEDYSHPPQSNDSKH